MTTVRALAFIVLLAAGCGGRVVVDHGSGGSGGASSTGSDTGGCTTSKLAGQVIADICVPMTAGGACAEDQLDEVAAKTTAACQSTPQCSCRYSVIAAPCPPGPGCCYSVAAIEMVVACE